jgi:hypothetical protein
VASINHFLVCEPILSPTRPKLVPRRKLSRLHRACLSGIWKPRMAPGWNVRASATPNWATLPLHTLRMSARRSADVFYSILTFESRTCRFAKGYPIESFWILVVQCFGLPDEACLEMNVIASADMTVKYEPETYCKRYR